MIEIIPAIDIIGGECVRLSQGDYGRCKTYYKDPLEAALRYEEAGVRRLHMVDLDGAKQSFPMNLDVLERVASHTRLEIQWGGGVKSREALEAVFAAGARRAICGSVAVMQPVSFREWLGEFGGDRVILGADVKDGFVATHGWLESSETTVEQVIDEFIQDGLQQVICTDISRDGMLAGPSFELYGRLAKLYPGLEVIVSGGISSMDDILKLNDMGLRSVIVGKAIYEGKITLEQISQCLQNA